MKKSWIINKIAVALVAVLALSACGMIDLTEEETAAEADEVEQQNSVVLDSQLNEEGVSVSLTDALEAMSDSFGISASSSTSLKLNNFDLLRRRNKQKSSTYSKSCEVDGLNAVVSVSATIDRERSFVNRNRSADWSVTGSEEVTRTWSKEVDDARVQVNCDSSAKYADIDWKGDLTGLGLDVEFSRSREASMSFIGKVKNFSFESDRKFSANGERHVTWDSQLESESGGEITRFKTIASNVDRTHYRKNSKGEEKQIDINIKTDDESPLVIETVRDASNLDLISQNIKSGILIGTRKGDGYIETSFANLKTEFAADECHLESGEVTYKLFKEGESEAAKIYILAIVDGEMTLTDKSTGEVKSEFEFENCDVKSFQE